MQRDASQIAVGLQDTRQEIQVVVDRVEENNDILKGNATLLDNIRGRLAWFMQLGLQLKAFMLRLMASQVYIFKELVTIRRAVQLNAMRSLDEEGFILSDAIGRTVRFPLRLIQSWVCFLTVIEFRFQGRKGFSKVQRREFILQDHLTRRAIHQTVEWDVAFQHNQQIEMSMVFWEPPDSEDNEDHCPFCRRRIEYRVSNSTQW
jgi:hypothetical protein